MPLALAESFAVPASLGQGKGVVVVPSEDEEDSGEGQVFKRRRIAQAPPQVVTSASSSSHGAESLREHPPSATSPPQPMALEGGVESEPAQPAPAPELPLPIQETLRGTWRKCLQAAKLKGPRRKA